MERITISLSSFLYYGSSKLTVCETLNFLTCSHLLIYFYDYQIGNTFRYDDGTKVFGQTIIKTFKDHKVRPRL